MKKFFLAFVLIALCTMPSALQAQDKKEDKTTPPPITLESELAGVTQTKTLLEQQYKEYTAIENYLNALKKNGYIIVKDTSKVQVDPPAGGEIPPGGKQVQVQENPIKKRTVQDQVTVPEKK